MIYEGDMGGRGGVVVEGCTGNGGSTGGGSQNY
jgi:hypothetical protein